MAAPELDDIFAAKIGAGDDQPEETEEPADEVVVAEPDEPEDETPDEVAERLYAGKYKNADELEKAYLEAQRLISQGAHKQPEPEPEYEEDAPLDIPLPLGGEPLTRAELEEWATNAPAAAAKWAMQREGLDPELRNAVVRHWAQSDPDSYVEEKLKAQMGSFQQQLMQTLAPQMQFVQQQQQQALLSTLQTNIKDWADIGPEILQHVQQNPQAIPPHVWQGGYPAVASFLDQFYGNAIRFQRYQAQVAAQQQAAPPAEPAAPGRAARAVTQTSSGAAAPAGNGQPSLDDLKAGILDGIKQAAGGGINLG